MTPHQSSPSKLLFDCRLLWVSLPMFLLLLSVQAAHATTYYVDSSIADKNPASATPDCTNYNSSTFRCSGGSADAYATVADINAGSFSPGDNILFRRGQTWREQLAVPSSGNSGSPITFGAFGSGADPVISGGDVVTGFSSTTVTSTDVIAAQSTIGSQANINNIAAQAWQATEWTPTSTLTLYSVNLQAWMVGTVTSGNVWVEVYKDDSGQPGSMITRGQSSMLNAATIPSSTTSYEFTFSGLPTLSGGSSYYFVVKSSYSQSSSNYIAFTASSGWDTNFIRWDWNGTSWTEKSTHSWYMQITEQKQITAYEASYGTQPKQVFKDDSRMTEAASSTDLSNNKWWWGSNILYVAFDAGNPDTLGYTITVSTRNRVLDVNGQDYVTIDGIDLTESNSVGLAMVASTSHIIFKNGRVLNSFIDNVGTCVACTVNYVTIEDSEIAYAGGIGIAAVGTANNWTVQRDKIHNNSQLPSSSISDQQFSGGLYIWDNDLGHMNNWLIQDNYVYDNGRLSDGTYVTDPSGGAVGFGIWLDTVQPSNSAGFSIIRYNYCIGDRVNEIRIENTDYAEVYGNLVISTAAGGSDNRSRGIAIWSYSGSGIPISYNKIYNNTVYNEDSGIAVVGSGSGTSNNVVGNDIENNIVASSARALETANGGENDGTMGSGNVYQYNDFGPAASQFIQWGNGTYFSAYSNWESSYCGSTGCSHSVESTPFFTSTSANNFTLQSGSPTINAGLNLGSSYEYGLDPASTWPSSVTTLNQNNYGSGWEVGAFVYDGSSGGPTVHITATVKTAISCSSVSSLTIAFGTLDSEAVSFTNPHYVSTTLSCNSGAGCALDLKDLGSSTASGLYAAGTAKYVINSPDAALGSTSTITAWTEGYGIAARTKAAGLAAPSP